MKKPNGKQVLSVLKTVGYWSLIALVVVILAVLAVAGLGVLIVGAVAGFVARVLLYGLIGSLLSWFTWTYMGLGALYFPGLDPVYQSIPFLHFFLVWSTLILLLRQLRKPTYGKVELKKAIDSFKKDKKPNLKVVK